MHRGKLSVLQCWQIKQSSELSRTSKASELLQKKFNLLRKALQSFSGISKLIPPAAQGGHRELPPPCGSCSHPPCRASFGCCCLELAGGAQGPLSQVRHCRLGKSLGKALSSVCSGSDLGKKTYSSMKKLY